MQPAPTQRFYLLFFLAIIVMIIHAYTYYPFTADDAFISYRYVDRFLEGKGLTWTDGRAVEGYSNLLWVLLLAAIRFVTKAELWIIALIVGLICSIISLYLLMRVTQRITNNDDKATAWAAFIFAVAAPVAIWINGGLEAPLVMVLLIAALSQLIRERLTTSNIVAAGIFLGLLALTRPDGILFCWAITLGWLLLQYFSQRPNTRFPKAVSGLISAYWRPLVLLNTIVAVFFVGQLLWRLKVYGEWVPNTARVKIGFTPRRLQEGSLYVAKMLLVYLPFLLLLLFNFKKMSRFVQGVLVLLVTVIVIESAYLSSIGGDIFPGYRHVLPLVPMLCIITGVVIAQILSKSIGFRNRVLYGLLMIIVCGVIYYAQAATYNNYTAKLERWEWNAKAIGSTLDSAFHDQQPMIATSAAGALPYYSKLPALDMLGLNDYYLPRHPPKDFGSGMLAHELGDADYYLRSKPDILFFYGLGYAEPYFKPEKDLFNNPEFQAQYQAVKLRYGMQYILPFPYYKKSFQPAIKLYDLSYIYFRRLSDRVGIRSLDDTTLMVPAYFLRNVLMPDSAATVNLAEGKSLVTRLVPSEQYFIPKSLTDSVFRGANPDLRVEALTLDHDSLVTGFRQGRIELSNPGKKPVELREIRLHLHN
jgi:arabinofuranosyltransferase